METHPRIDLSIVIPSHNEEKRLATSLPHILSYLEARRGSYEVLVVDDGSNDGTAEVAESFSRFPVSIHRHERQRGKGAAVTTGMLASRGDWVLLTDADLSTPIEDLERLEARRARANVVVGSRSLPSAEIRPRQPIYREFLGKGFNAILRLLRLTTLGDTQCGFKLLQGDLARRVAGDLRIQGFAFDIELLWHLERSGERIQEVGVRWGHSPPSTVHLFKDSFRMLRDVLLFRTRTLLSSSARDPAREEGRTPE